MIQQIQKIKPCYIYWLFLFVTVFSLLSLAGCKKTPSDNNREQDTQQELNLNREKWDSHNINIYQYKYELKCFCDPKAVKPVVITVDTDLITSIVYFENGESVGLSENNQDAYKTVNQIFDIIQDAIDRHAEMISVTYHTELGYPSDVFIDYDNFIADEERGFLVKNLEKL